MEPMIEEILEDLTTELGLKKESDVAVLPSKVKNAVREVRLKCNYPEYSSGDQIANDLKKHYSNIRELALYDFNQNGVKRQTSHNENGTNRTWKSRNDCLIGVLAYCG